MNNDNFKSFGPGALEKAISFNHHDIFVSQQNQKPYSDTGCGVACLFMLLKFIQLQPLPTWKDLCDALKLDVSPIKKGYSIDDPEIGLYPEDLFRYVIQQNLPFRMQFFDDEWEASLKNVPIMVLLDGILKEFPNEAHWVVLIAYKNKQFTYLDPWYEEEKDYLKTISWTKFKSHYTGVACQLLKKEIF
ncbi:TPA: C39 family peptidase [Legionella pneumophila]|jgi:uncharacterized protein YvpB|uniref:C39 family peptidase n=1 Tax=Legionella pneumophila TaxID=446 RepID=UPI00077C9DF0|nr:C39 family peptidase [Legionella pneumophila]AMQ28344.1 hypothetical protein lpt_10295 [Legionella pneumophila subsp. pneumophila]MBN5929559.1 C39 family peptidase [Legionella pneumophila]MDW8967274.1 C39 family peptidase [Legionella pneumophila]MDW9135171.1 C39 family peptidase [Legionella pneumophila]MDW9141404.1 C39 family peptidase [Legionella pneumophila]